MKKWRLITGVALVLVLGILIGSAGTQFYFRHRYHLFPDRNARMARVLNTFSKELDLSQDQKVAVGKILQETAEKLRLHYLRGRPEAERIFDESFAEIRQGLNDAQKKKLDSLRERYQRHRRFPDR